MVDFVLCRVRLCLYDHSLLQYDVKLTPVRCSAEAILTSCFGPNKNVYKDVI